MLCEMALCEMPLCEMVLCETSDERLRLRVQWILDPIALGRSISRK